MPYYFQMFKKRDLYVQTNVRAKLDSNGVPLQFDTDQKPIFSFFPAANGILEYPTRQTYIPICQYNAPTKTYVTPISSITKFMVDNHVLQTGLSAFITKGRATSGARITNVQLNAAAYIDSYDNNTRVFTFTNAYSAVLSAIGTGENFALRFSDYFIPTPFYVVVKKRDTTNGNITATQDFIGQSYGSPAQYQNFDITTFQVDRDLWGASYTSVNPLTSRAYTTSLTGTVTLNGIKAPSQSPFVSSRWNVSNGYLGLTKQAKRNKLYITAYNSSTKTYTLSSVYPFTAGNSYDTSFFYNGLSTTVYHNNRQKQIVVGGINTTLKTFSASREVWGSSYTVPTSAIRRNYVLDLTIPVVDSTSGDWHMFKGNRMQELALSTIYCDTVNRCLCAQSTQLIRDTGALSGYSKPFNLIADTKSYRLRYRTPASGGLPARWINDKKTAFTEYSVNIATLTSTIINTANYTLTANYDASVARDNYYTQVTFAGQTKTAAITTYPVSHNIYSANNTLLQVTQLYPLTTNVPFSYTEQGFINNYNALSSLSFVSVSGGGSGGIYNGVYYPTSNIVNGKRVYKNYYSSVLFFDSSNWAIRPTINYDTDTLYYAPEAALAYPWQSAAWVLSTGDAPAPVVTELRSTYGSKTSQTTNTTYVLDAGRGMIYAYNKYGNQSSFINIRDFTYNGILDPYLEFYDICATSTGRADDTDYIAVSLKYKDTFDPSLSYYDVQVFVASSTIAGVKLFSLDSSTLPHLASQTNANRDTAMFISSNGHAANNGKPNLAMLYIARANNTYYSGCTGVIDIISLNNSAYLSCIYLNNSYFKTKYPALTNYKFGAAIAASQNSFFYTISSPTDNTKNIVEYCQITGNTINAQYRFAPTSILSSSENNFGKYLNAYGTLNNNPYNDLSIGYVTDTDRLLVGGDTNMNVYEKYFSSFLPLSSVAAKNTKCLAYYTNVIGYSGNRVNFYALSTVC